MPRAKKIEVGPESTFFRVGDEGRELPTADFATAFDAYAASYAVAGGALLGAGVGAVFGATLGKRPERVVYAAPLARYLRVEGFENAAAGAE